MPGVAPCGRSVFTYNLFTLYRVAVMLSRLGTFLQRWSSRVVPDPFVLALLLTVLVMLVGAVRLASVGEAGVVGTVLTGWAGGFASSGGLSFALQMSLILVTGHALALSAPVQRFIGVVAQIPRGTASAAFIVALVSCGAAILHWGLGAIVGAFMAREVARSAYARGLRLHYPLLGGAAYSGFAVWHGGLSGSAPLKVAEDGHFAAELVGVIPLSETLFGASNLLITGFLFVAIPLMFLALAPKDHSHIVEPDGSVLRTVRPREKVVGQGLMSFLQESVWPGRLVGGAGVALVVLGVSLARLTLDLNTVILFFLFLGILFQGSLRGYVDTVTDGAAGAGGIILQFPFYFGILGVMQATGLIAVISDALIAVSTPMTFPVMAFLSAGVVNFFVPSGGGQWAVQAEILLGAGRSLGANPAATVMAFAYGDAWTNMLQPFWSLPLLGIMGLQARDIIGYTALVFLLMLVVVPLGLVLLAV